MSSKNETRTLRSEKKKREVREQGDGSLKEKVWVVPSRDVSQDREDMFSRVC